MKNAFNGVAQIHPMVVFWLGLLTGALIVGLAFFYRVLNPTDFESALLRATQLNTRATTQIAPTTRSLNVLTSPTSDLNAFPTPQGGYNAFPTPQGG